MGLRSLGICFVLLLSTVVQESRAATLSTSVVNGVLGRSGNSISCLYQLQGSETFRQLDIIFLDRSEIIGSLLNDENGGQITPGVGFDSTRSNLTFKPVENRFSLEYIDTLCSDDGVQYQCKFSYVTDIIDEQTASTQMKVEAPPQSPPDEMQVVTNQRFTSNSVQEFTVISFTCSGDVGNPAGDFQWFLYKGNEYTDETNSDMVTRFAPTEDGCSFRRQSRLTYNATRTMIGKDLVARCRLFQAEHGDNNNDDMDCGVNDTYCRMSQKIAVHYPVQVSASVVPPQPIVEGQAATLTCDFDSNPAAYGTVWYQGDADNVLANSSVLDVSGLLVNDTGLYTCVSFNDVAGVTYNDTATVQLTVVKSTTPVPTTPTSPSTQGPTDSGEPGEQGAAKAGTDDTTTIIVAVVVPVVLIAIVIVVVIVVCKRRQRKEVEEPPEKPFNNHAGINTLATRPDLVSNDNIYPPAYNNAGGFKNEDGLTYAELQFDNKPRSRRPLALDDTHTDYSDVSMPQV